MKKTGSGINPSPDAGKVVIYAGRSGKAGMEVRLKGETVWLSLNQMAGLFGRDKSVISRHIGNIFRERELFRASVVAKFATTAADGKIYSVEHYNLDVIISVGYRVKSVNGTRFRIWAAGVLKKHLIEGYTLNNRLLAEQKEKLEALKKAIALVRHARVSKRLDYAEVSGLLEIIENYSYALGLLDDYDRGRMRVSGTTASVGFRLTYRLVVNAVVELRSFWRASGLFGLEKDQSLKSSLGAIYQTFDGKDLYPSAEEKAAALLYFMVKNHSFVDGNKRIAAAVFLWFLEKSRLLYRFDGSKRLADNAVVALTLMIAASRPGEKAAINALVVNLINGRN